MTSSTIYPVASLGCTVPSTDDKFTIAIRFINNETNTPRVMHTIGADAMGACEVLDTVSMLNGYGTSCPNFGTFLEYIHSHILDGSNVAMTSSLEVFISKVKNYYDTTLNL